MVHQAIAPVGSFTCEVWVTRVTAQGRSTMMYHSAIPVRHGDAGESQYYSLSDPVVTVCHNAASFDICWRLRGVGSCGRGCDCRKLQCVSAECIGAATIGACIRTYARWSRDARHAGGNAAGLPSQAGFGTELHRCNRQLRTGVDRRGGCTRVVQAFVKCQQGCTMIIGS
jgi:hypothetical protein